ncbi:MAG: Cdc6/Cdc18 family protein [Candidatus Odinarchaeota archaeon]
MASLNRETVIANAFFLDEDFIPDKLQFREKQVDTITARYKAIFHYAYSKSGYSKGLASATGSLNERIVGSPAGDILLLGGSGTGKTAVMRHTLGQIREFLSRSPWVPASSPRVLTAFIDCMSVDKERSFWIQLAKEIGSYYTSTSSTDQIIQQIKELLSTSYLIIMLDELDGLLENFPEKESESILFHLSRQPGTMIIAAANKTNWRQLLPGKSHSSFIPETVMCERYRSDELQAICMERVINGLQTGVIDESRVLMLAENAYRLGGDARKLIKMLRIAVDHAIECDRAVIKNEDVEHAMSQIEDEAGIQYVINRAHDTHALLIVLSKAPRKLRSEEIQDEYEKLMKKVGKRPLKYRTIMDLLADLKNEGIIQKRKANIRGNVFYYWLDTSWIDKKKILTLLADSCSNCKKVI